MCCSKSYQPSSCIRPKKVLAVQKYLSVLYTRHRPQSFKSIHVDVNDFGLYVMYILHHSCTKKTTKQLSSYVARILSLSLFVFYIIKNHRATVMTYHCKQIHNTNNVGVDYDFSRHYPS